MGTLTMGMLILKKECEFNSGNGNIDNGNGEIYNGNGNIDNGNENISIPHSLEEPVHPFYYRYVLRENYYNTTASYLLF